MRRILDSLGARAACIGASIIVATWTCTPVAMGAQRAPSAEAYAVRCGASAVASDGTRYVSLPRGDVFCPLLADPKAMRSFVSYQRGDASDFARNIAAVGIADQFAFFRINGANGDGVQLGVSGAVFAQFDLAAPSIDLLNADYQIALPLTMRRGGVSSRVRIYHQSSHLGDELLLRPEPPERENLSFEAVDGVVSMDVGFVRVYGGGEHYFGRDPVTLPRSLLHTGFELRPRAMARFGNVVTIRTIGGADLKAVKDSDWRVGVNVRAGLEFARPREGEQTGRRWCLLADFYDGLSPYGQFFTSDIRLVGIGLHFSL